MRVCPKCDAWISIYYKFCPYCGLKLPPIKPGEYRYEEGRPTRKIHRYR